MTTTTPQQYPLPVSETTTSLVLVPSSSTTGGAAAAATSGNSVTKDQLKDYLRQWVRVENEISTLFAEIKKTPTPNLFFQKHL